MLLNLRGGCGEKGDRVFLIGETCCCTTILNMEISHWGMTGSVSIHYKSTSTLTPRVSALG